MGATSHYKRHQSFIDQRYQLVVRWVKNYEHAQTFKLQIELQPGNQNNYVLLGSLESLALALNLKHTQTCMVTANSICLLESVNLSRLPAGSVEMISYGHFRLILSWRPQYLCC